MPFDDSPQAFFGPGYALASSEVKLPTSDIADITIGTFTCDGTTATITVSTDHNLKVGDKVSLSTTTTLPAPFTASDYFVVSAPTSTTLTLATSRGGTAVVSTDTGTGTHTIKALGTLQELTDTEANASTGDWRKIVYAIMEMLYQKYLNTPSADRPSRVTISRSSSTNEQTGRMTRNYTVSIVTDIAGVEVSAE